MLKALPNGLIRLGRDPEPLGLPLPARLHHDPPGYQFAFPSGVRGNHQFRHIAPLHQRGNCLKLPPGFRDHHQLHILGQHGKVLHVPLFILFIIYVRVRQCHQMSQRPCDNISFSLQIAVAALLAAQHSGQFTAHRGFFCQYQRFCHIATSLIPVSEFLMV